MTTNLSQTLSSTGAPFKPSSVIKPVARHHSGVSGLATTSSIDFDGQSVTRTMQREALSSSSSSTSSSAVIAGASPLANRKRPISVLENNIKEHKLDNTKEKTETTALDDLLGKLVSSSSSSFSHSSAPTLSRTMISSSLSDTEDHQYPSLSNTGTVQANLGTETDFGVVIRPSKRIAMDTSNITRDLDVKSNSTSTLKSRQQEFLYASGARRDAKNQSEELVQVQQRKVMTQGANPPQRKRQAQDGYNEVLDGETGGDIDVESATAHQEYYDEYEEDEDEDMHEDELVDEELTEEGRTNKSSWKLIESKPNGKRARDSELTSSRRRHGNSQILSLSSSSTSLSSKKVMMVETLKPRQILPLSRQVISGSGKGTSGRFLLSSSSASSGAGASSANTSSPGGIIRSKGGILISRETVKNMVTVGTQTVPMSEAGVQTFSRAASSASSSSYLGDIDSSFNSTSFSSSSAFDGSRSRLRRVQPSVGSTLDYSLSSGVQSHSESGLGENKDKDNTASILASSSSSAQAFRVMQQPTTEKDADLSSSKAHVGGSQEPIKSSEGGERNINKNETPSFSFGTAKVEKTTSDFAAPASSSSFSFSFGKPAETAQVAQTSTAIDTLKPSLGDAGADEEDDRRRKLKKPSVSFPGLPPISSSSSEQTPVPTSTSGSFSFAPIPSLAPVNQQAMSNSESSTSSSAPPPPPPLPVSAPASASSVAPAPFSFGSGTSSGSLFGNGSFGLAPPSSSSAPVNLSSAPSAALPPLQIEKASTSVPFSLVDSGSTETAPTDMNKKSLLGSSFSSTAPSTAASIPPPTATASLSTFTFGSSSSSLFKSSDLTKTNSVNKEGGGGLGLPNTTSSSITTSVAPASTTIVFGSQPTTSNLQSTTQLVPSFSFSSNAPPTALSLGAPIASTASSVPTSFVNPNANPGSATSQWDTPASTVNNAPSSSSFGFSIPGASATSTFSSTNPSVAPGTASAPQASTGSATAGTGAAAMLASTFSFGGTGGGFGNTTFPPPPASFSFGTAAPSSSTSTLPAFGATSLGGGATTTTTNGGSINTTSLPGAPLAALSSFTFGQSFQPQSSISSTSSFGL